MTKIEEDVFVEILVNDGFKRLVEEFDLDIDFSRQTDKSESVTRMTSISKERKR